MSLTACKPLLPYFSIIGVVLIFFSHLFFPAPRVFFTPDYSGSDQWHQHYPYKDYLSKRLKTFQLPLWNPDIATGYPQLAEGQTGTFFLPNLVLFFLLPTWMAWNLSFVMVSLISFVGSYLWLHAYRLSRLTSWLGGFWITFGGFMISHYVHLPLIQTAVMLPWLLWLAHRYSVYQRLSTLWWLSFWVAQQWFAGHAQMAVINGIGLGLYTIAIYLWQPHHKKRRPSGLQLLIGIGGAVGLGTLLSSVQLVPSWELLQQSSRSLGLTAAEQFAYPYPLTALGTFLFPYWFGNPHQGNFAIPSGQEGIFWENLGYLGWVPLIFALVSLTLINKYRLPRVHLAYRSLFVGIVVVLFLLGGLTPAGWIYRLPPLSYVRLPARFLGLFSLCLSFLAASGVDCLRAYLKSLGTTKRVQNLIMVLLLSLSVLDLGYFAYYYHPTIAVPKLLAPPAILQQIPTQARILSSGRQQLFWQQQVIKTGWQDMDAFLAFKSGLAPNQNLLFDRTQLNGYTALETQRYQAFFAHFSSALAQASGLTHLITPELLDLPHLQLVPPKTALEPNRMTFYLYAHTQPLPRFRLVSKYKTASSLLQATHLTETMDTLIDTVVIETQRKLEQTPLTQSTVHVVRDTPQHIVLKTVTEQAAWLVAADSFYPGWYALIDDQETPIYPANINQRAVRVPKGTHQVVFRYHPRSFYAGVWVSSLAGLLWLGVGLWLWHGNKGGSSQNLS